MAVGVPRWAPAERMGGPQADIWTTVNEAVKASLFQPVINLGQGFFGYNPPEFLIKALQEAVERVECNQYSPPLGRLSLRKALATSYSTHTGREINANEFLITTGANEGILSIIIAYVNPGDEVIIMEPLFDQFVRNVNLAGGIPKFVSLSPPKTGSARQKKLNGSAAEWTFDIDELEAVVSERTKLLIINNPHNPTGKVFTRTELETLGRFCQSHNLLILSDEVYSRFALSDSNADNPLTHTASMFSDITLTVGSVGKDFAATGWRVGFVTGRPSLLGPVATAHRHICYASPSAPQEAAALGYEIAERKGYWDWMRSNIARKMERLCAVFEELGIPYYKPDGGYMVLASLAKVCIPEAYVFPGTVADADRESQMCWFLVNEIGVAGLPSSGFYVTVSQAMRDAMLFRFAVCREDDVLGVACERLRELREYISLE
ncbi:pyridoxal phosphate-dependent aminotransferase [Aspergillus undulatus]|uniref:pyridoxal phosphate-dependent aminotransferase n=1 Tax=Aspergillus undulatus TaxID=1810928 RepID=UPI003CCD4F0D